MASDVVVRLDWNTSSMLLRALRHPLESGSQAILEQHAQAIGQARLGLANEAAVAAMARLKTGRPD
jgi:hypothetical protein